MRLGLGLRRGGRASAEGRSDDQRGPRHGLVAGLLPEVSVARPEGAADALRAALELWEAAGQLRCVAQWQRGRISGGLALQQCGEVSGGLALQQCGLDAPRGRRLGCLLLRSARPRPGEERATDRWPPCRNSPAARCRGPLSGAALCGQPAAGFSCCSAAVGSSEKREAAALPRGQHRPRSSGHEVSQRDTVSEGGRGDAVVE